MEQQQRKRGIFLFIIAYSIAVGVAWLIIRALPEYNPIIKAAIADGAATVIIFLFSVIVNNSSMYDPYWSVAPPLIALYWFTAAGELVTIRLVFVFALVLFWGVRLTYNWAHQWTDLSHEDWRYRDFRENHGKRYWLVSFGGIHFFPTLLVFFGCLSLYPAVTVHTRGFNILDVAAIAVTGGAVLIETISDKQLFRFRIQKAGKHDVCEEGLWAYSRHPNYFGEVSFWWGLFLFGLAASPAYWWTIIGPAAMTLLFLFISIPMMEEREEQRKPGYSEYKSRTSPFIPWFRGDRSAGDVSY